MFAFLELPRAFDVTRDTFVSLSEQVVSLLLEHSEERLVRSNESLDEIVKAKKGVYWVSEGSLLLQYQDKRILAFETNECIGLDTLAGDSPFSFANELAVGIRFIEIEKLGALFESVPDLATKYVSLQSAYATVLSQLLSTSPHLDNAFDPIILAVEPGEVVIEEGVKENDIYTLVKGELEVSVKGVVVGNIREGEVFGVIAAFTDGVRTATLKASRPSMVMKLPKEEFDVLVRQRPSLITNLVESLSRTIVELDAKVLQFQR